MLNFLKSHSIALAVAIVLLGIVLIFLPVKEASLQFSERNIQVEQTVTNGLLPNLNGTSNDVSNYLASIKNPSGLTLFGSSEFNSSDYASYKFFTSKNGYQVLGIGHAHHQLLSILIELLAADNFVEGASVSIFLSPGWFQSGEGTNSSAFVEFAKPELLSNIITSNIKSKYKEHIGKFIYEQKSNFNAFPVEFDYLANYYASMNFTSLLMRFEHTLTNKIKGLFKYNYYIDKNNYQFQLIQNQKQTSVETLDSIALAEKSDFLNKITNNKLVVSDEYYSKYLVDENGNERSATVDPINLKRNKEYQDFKLVVDYIKEKKINASFIMMPLNPYYFSNLENLTPLMKAIENNLKANKIPYYDMYVTNKDAYEDGLLRDVMHIGDFGWIRINQFLQDVYFKN